MNLPVFITSMFVASTAVAQEAAAESCGVVCHLGSVVDLAFANPVASVLVLVAAGAGFWYFRR